MRSVAWKRGGNVGSVWNFWNILEPLELLEQGVLIGVFSLLLLNSWPSREFSAVEHSNILGRWEGYKVYRTNLSLAPGIIERNFSRAS